MQQGSKDSKGQGDKIINQFIQGFLDTRRNEYKKLKEINLVRRKLIETRLSQEPDIKYLLFRYKDDPWIQKILIRYIHLKLSHHTTFWGADDLQPKPKKNKRFQYEGHLF